MKKILAIGLIVTFIIGLMPATVYADSLELNAVENERMQEIESILAEISRINARKKHQEFLLEKGVITMSNATRMNCENLTDREHELEEALCELGVHKIDISNEADIELLNQLSEASVMNSRGAAPDFAAIASVYKIYIVDGVYTKAGKDYKYRRIEVIDNKGRNGLTKTAEYDMAGSTIGASVMGGFLNYSFGYVASYLLGNISINPIEGILIDYTLGAIFDILNNVDPGVISCGNEPIYRTLCISVTRMKYWYYENSDDWKLIGVAGTVDFERTHVFAGNVNGSAVTEYYTEEWATTTEKATNMYINSYISAMANNPNYCTVDYLGKIVIKGFNRNYEFEPVFYAQPGYIW